MRRGNGAIRCFVRPGSNAKLKELAALHGAGIEYAIGNLTSRSACEEAVRDVDVILHLAAGLKGALPTW